MLEMPARIENYTYFDYHEKRYSDKCHNKGFIKKRVDDLIDIIFIRILNAFDWRLQCVR